MYKRLFASRREIRIALFGPALETTASSLVQELLWGRSSPYTVTGMFPGVQGTIIIFTGVCLTMPLVLYKRCHWAILSSPFY